MVENITSMALNTAKSLLNQIAVGIVILITGLALGLLVQKVALRLLQEIEFNKIISRTGLNYNAEYWISSLLSYIIYLSTIILVLNQLGIRSLVIYLIAAGTIILIILTFIAGIKDIIPNLLGGAYLRRQQKLKEGHWLELPEVSGTVQHIGYLETEIKTKKGEVLHVPNALFSRKKASS